MPAYAPNPGPILPVGTEKEPPENPPCGSTFALPPALGPQPPWAVTISTDEVDQPRERGPLEVEYELATPAPAKSPTPRTP